MTVGSKISVDGAGRDLVAGDVAVSAGFGSTASKTLLAGSNDAAGRVVVTSAGTGQAVDATVTITFAKAKGRAPVGFAQRGDDDQAVGEIRVECTTTTAVITFEGLPVAAEVYEFNYLIVEL